MRRLILLSFCLWYFTVVECQRGKRDLGQFAKMIHLTTGRDPLDFSDYGNWCGYGGSGDIVDAIDACCHRHDNCYDEVAANPLCQKTYTIRYEWRARNGSIDCDTRMCRGDLCKCDRTAALCFQQNLGVFNRAHLGRFGGIISKLSQTFFSNK